MFGREHFTIYENLYYIYNPINPYRYILIQYLGVRSSSENFAALNTVQTYASQDSSRCWLKRQSSGPRRIDIFRRLRACIIRSCGGLFRPASVPH